MNWLTSVERTVTGLGYDLVDTERAPGGLLRVYIDRVAGDPGGGFVTVDDCERVTRQLQHVLEVDGVDYARLEVSSPGLDRPLKKAADYRRFLGEQVEVTLKMPFEGRKKYRGELAEPDDAAPADATGVPARFRVVFDDGKRGPQALDFALDEVREARLVPVVDFKGRRFAQPEAPADVPGPDDGDPQR